MDLGVNAVAPPAHLADVVALESGGVVGARALCVFSLLHLLLRFSYWILPVSERNDALLLEDLDELLGALLGVFFLFFQCF